MNGKALWRRFLPLGLRQAANPGVEALALRQHIKLTRRLQPKTGPLIVSGYFNRPIGVGRAAALTLNALKHAGLSPLAHDLDSTASPDTLAGFTSGGVWLLHCNAPEAIYAVRNYPEGTEHRPYRIGYWVYELPRTPPAWRHISQLFDEIWVPSTYVAAAMETYPVPVRVMPHPLPPRFPETRNLSASEPNPSNCFRVFAAGDLRSSQSRKNLVGAISIFKQAFPEATSKAHLTVKVTAGAADDHSRARILQLAKSRPDIEVIETQLDDLAMAALLQSADLILSPHRAEGFGLLLAEGFQLGTPSLATGWSGNLDYMGALPELLIEHQLVRVKDDTGIYRRGSGVWAEPDEADAVEKLQRLAGDSALRARLAQQGQAAIAKANHAWSKSALAGMEFSRYLAVGPSTSAPNNDSKNSGFSAAKRRPENSANSRER